MKTFVLGDVHGAYKALLQCFQRSGFDYKKDRLIVLGDVCDGYPEVKQCIDELLKITHCDYIIGNHDLWALDWATKGIKEDLWLKQGGLNTIASYDGQGMPQTHIDLFKNAHMYIELNNKLFVHGGFEHRIPISKQGLQTLVWDRDLLEGALKTHWTDPKFKFAGYDEIYIGHTTTQMYKSLQPLHFCNVWGLDTGAGWSGMLTIMDVNTHEYWQSELSSTLYGGTPDQLIRNGA